MPVPHRVLHLIHSDQRRGAEVFAGQLASCLESNGQFKNAVCILHPGQGEGLEWGDLPVFRLLGAPGFLRRMGLDQKLLSRLLGEMRDFQPDIVVAHGSDTLKYGGCASLFYSRASWVYRNIGTASAWASSSLKIRLNRLFLSRFNTVVSVSQFTRRDFIQVYRLPQGRVTYIPNGVDAAEFVIADDGTIRQQVRREIGIPPDAVVLVSAGNLSEEKGPSRLLSIVADLTGAGLDVLLVIAGDGPLRQHLEEQAWEPRLAGRVHFLGRRADVPRLLAASDVFVLTSRTEGMPGVLVEAGLAGLPSVAFNVGGVAEVVDDGVTGLLVAPGDSAGFSAALARLHLDPGTRACMGNAARQLCRESFDIRQVAQQYQELFLNILGAPPGAPPKEREWANVRK